jgi:hypothetical protein
MCKCGKTFRRRQPATEKILTQLWLFGKRSSEVAAAGLALAAANKKLLRETVESELAVQKGERGRNDLKELANADGTLLLLAEKFIEEFMFLHVDAQQILSLFKNPQYAGPHLVYTRHGEAFVRELIVEAFVNRGQRFAKHSPSLKQDRLPC